MSSPAQNTRSKTGAMLNTPPSEEDVSLVAQLEAELKQLKAELKREKGKNRQLKTDSQHLRRMYDAASNHRKYLEREVAQLRYRMHTMDPSLSRETLQREVSQLKYRNQELTTMLRTSEEMRDFGEREVEGLRSRLRDVAADALLRIGHLQEENGRLQEENHSLLRQLNGKSAATRTEPITLTPADVDWRLTPKPRLGLLLKESLAELTALRRDAAELHAALDSETFARLREERKARSLEDKVKELQEALERETDAKLLEWRKARSLQDEKNSLIKELKETRSLLAEKTRELEEAVARRPCAVCLSELATQVFSNCHHLCVCVECRDRICQPLGRNCWYGRCPMCRRHGPAGPVHFT